MFLPVSALPPEAEIGAALAVDTQDDLGAWRPRFAGRVTDVAVTWAAPQGDDPVPVPQASITAVGPLATLGRRYVGDVPWPAELDGARAARVLALAGGSLGVVDPGTLNVLARDVDLRSALDVLTDVATSAGGILWETAGGLVGYADADHRRNMAVAVTLDSCDVLMAPVWTRTVEGVVNDVSVSYGVPAAGGSEQPTYAANRPESIATYGRYAYALRSELAAVADAQARAQLLLVRGAQPAWNLTSLPLDLSILSDVTTRAVLGLDMHSLLGLTGFPAGGPPETSLTLWVEGWSETLTYGGHELTLAVSAYCRTVPPPQWDNVPPSWTWDTVDAGAVIRTNLLPNPRFGVDLNGWWEYGGTNARLAGQGATGWALGTDTCVRATFQDAAVVPTYATGVYTDLFPVTEGEFYAALLQVRSNRPQRVSISIEFYDAAGNVYVGSSWETETAEVAVLTPNVVETLVNLPFGAMTGAETILIGIYPAPNNTGDGGPSIVSWVAGDWMEVTNVQLEKTTADGVILTATADPVTGIFHGSLPDRPGDRFDWTSTPDASPSTRTKSDVRENLCPNPSVETTADGYGAAPAAGGAATLARVAGGVAGQWMVQAKWTVAPTSIEWGGVYTQLTNPDSVLPNRTYTGSAFVRPSRTQLMTVLADTRDVGNTVQLPGFTSPAVSCPANVWTRLSVTFTPTDARTSRVTLGFYSASPGGVFWQVGDTLDVDAVMTEETDALLGYFDGATPDTLSADYSWTGAAHASTSRRTSPPPLTWDAATCFGPQPSLGRWADASASMRWDDVTTGITWDTWPY